MINILTEFISDIVSISQLIKAFILCPQLCMSTQQCQQVRSVTQIAASQITNNHWMYHNSTLFQQSDKSMTASAQMTNPDRNACQYHYASCSDWRGMGSSCGSLPPKSARRQALSRSTKAFKPSRTIALFSLIPVKSAAFLYKPLSIVTLVRIASPLFTSKLASFFAVFGVLSALVKACRESEGYSL